MALLQAILDGLMLGGVYAVISIGLTLVFGVVSIVNFAQAQFLMVGMYVAYFCWKHLGLDPIAGSLVSFAVVFVLGYFVQHWLLRRVLKAPEVAQIFLTVGILIVLENLALVAFGSEFKSVQTSYQNEALEFAGLIVSLPYLIAFCASALAGLGVWWVLARTWWGRTVRATAQDAMAARLLGINPDQTYRLAFGLGVGLTAFGGAIILPYLTVSPAAGEQFGVLMFTVVVLGGLGNVLGAVVGGLAVGVIQSLSGLYLPLQLQNWCCSSSSSPPWLCGPRVCCGAVHECPYAAASPRGSSKVAKPHLLESGTAQPLARTQIIWLALLLAACIVPWLISPQGYAIRVLTLLLLFAAMPRPGTSLVA